MPIPDLLVDLGASPVDLADHRGSILEVAQQLRRQPLRRPPWRRGELRPAWPAERSLWAAAPAIRGRAAVGRFDRPRRASTGSIIRRRSCMSGKLPHDFLHLQVAARGRAGTRSPLSERSPCQSSTVQGNSRKGTSFPEWCVGSAQPPLRSARTPARYQKDFWRRAKSVAIREGTTRPTSKPLRYIAAD